MRFAILSLVAVMMLGGPAFAAEEVAPGEHKDAASNEHGQGEKSGGPDFTGFKRYDLGLYTLVVFGLLLFVLSKFAWPHIAAGLKKREAAILGEREEALKARKEAEELRGKLHKDLADAQDKIRGMLDEA